MKVLWTVLVCFFFLTEGKIFVYMWSRPPPLSLISQQIRFTYANHRVKWRQKALNAKKQKDAHKTITFLPVFIFQIGIIHIVLSVFISLRVAKRTFWVWFSLKKRWKVRNHCKPGCRSFTKHLTTKFHPRRIFFKSHINIFAHSIEIPLVRTWHNYFWPFLNICSDLLCLLHDVTVELSRYSTDVLVWLVAGKSTGCINVCDVTVAFCCTSCQDAQY